MTRSIFTTLLLFLCLVLKAEDIGQIKPHPRIFTSEKTLTKLRKEIVAGKNENLKVINTALLKSNGVAITSESAGTSLFDTATVITSSVYSYRVTGEKKYFDRATELVTALCCLPDWHPEHFLDVSAASLACSMYYDWLYDDLPDPLRDQILSALQTHVIDAAKDPRYSHFLIKINNWNQVCNTGVILAGLCLYDRDPALARCIILDALERNRPIASTMFAPDGIYPEGPGYTLFGGGWQMAMIAALESAFGSDFGLLSSPGLERLGDFLVATTGPSGLAFDYSDNTERNAATFLLWTLADYFDKPYYIYLDKFLGQDSNYLDKGLKKAGALLPLYALSAMRIGKKRIPEPPSTLFYGHGIQPLCTVRSGWDRDAMYLAIKGGNPSIGHSHLDVGSFVLDAHGLRWAQEVKGRSYKFYEKNLSNRRDLWRKTPDALRWRLFRYNNRQHNTLTINDKDHCVTGYAPMVSVIDTRDKKGACFDLNNAFQGMTMQVKRTAVLVKGQYVEITDEIQASEDDVCEVMWNMATPAKAELVQDGIILTQGGYKMKLSSDCPRVEWFVETAQERAQKTAYAPWDNPVGESMFCGYTIRINKAERVVVNVIIQDVQ